MLRQVVSNPAPRCLMDPDCARWDRSGAWSHRPIAWLWAAAVEDHRLQSDDVIVVAPEKSVRTVPPEPVLPRPLESWNDAKPGGQYDKGVTAPRGRPARWSRLSHAHPGPARSQQQICFPEHLYGVEVVADLSVSERAGLARSALARDPAAFAELVRLYDRDLVRVSFVVCGDAELALDAAQNAWQRLWRDPPKLRDEHKLHSWLLAVSANEARQLVRRRRRLGVLEARIAPSTWVGDVSSEDRLDMRRALAALSPDERELIGLRYVLEMPSQEIAQHLRVSAVAVRSRLHRLLGRLRKELSRE